MIYTSYFARLSKLPENTVPIAICQYPPKWYQSGPNGPLGAVVKELSPTPSILWEYKDDPNEERYTRRFKEEVLGKLSIGDVMRMLTDKLPFEALATLGEEGVPIWESKKVHIALICFEKEADFCHRHIVADWIKEKIRELTGRECIIEEFDGKQYIHLTELSSDLQKEVDRDEER